MLGGGIVTPQKSLWGEKPVSNDIRCIVAQKGRTRTAKGEAKRERGSPKVSKARRNRDPRTYDDQQAMSIQRQHIYERREASEMLTKGSEARRCKSRAKARRLLDPG